MRQCLTFALAALLLTGTTLMAQERRDKPDSEKPGKPEFKPPFGRGPGFGPFRPPANREEAMQRVRQQLEFARNMVRQLEEQLKRLESGEGAADSRKPEPRREAEARKPEKLETPKPEARGPDRAEPRGRAPADKPEARRPRPPGKPGFDQFQGRFGDRWSPWSWRPPAGRGPWPRFAPWWPGRGWFGPPAWGWPRWGWTPRFAPPPAPRFGPPHRPTTPRAGSSRDLESRLDRLARDLEELRRELRQRR
ncbi:hypothetical protein HRbin36_02144 [bacterium HR36]|nr:hypothetical protein HRbin36_02144 [bacterium HR36]